ncbi:MAG: cysteine--tRNA ligase [Rickettsiales bacterium]|jgi:cysteinyl-tRNA synthetase|nr:cysteine--tRNA ligase [Rickettsiales bacterium]
MTSMDLKIYNSFSKQLEIFEPIDPNDVRFYCCGITVYDRAHIGNAKTYISADILYRVLKELYKNVKYVRNITDVDDKINKRAVERKITIQQLTTETTDLMHKDFSYLHLLDPDVEPKVTEHIPEIISLIQRLIGNGNAYEVEGHVLFDTLSFKDYGKLSGRNLDDMAIGARIEVAPYKKNPTDFVLWKPSADTDDESAKFKSPFGVGRPGWHIECSAMSYKHLGENFDIHLGGNDLKFPHHENEIAQSCCAFQNSMFAKYWMHIGFLLVNGEKMSKSLNNFYTLKDIQDKGFKGVALKYAFLKNHYRTPFNFTFDLLNEASKNLFDFHKIIKDVVADEELDKKILEFLCDDLNTPKVLAELHNFKKEPSKLKKALEFLGLYDTSYYETKQLKNISEEEIKQKIKIRLEAKKNKDYAKADEIRVYLENNGVLLKDRDGGTDWEIV